MRRFVFSLMTVLLLFTVSIASTSFYDVDIGKQETQSVILESDDAQTVYFCQRTDIIQTSYEAMVNQPAFEELNCPASETYIEYLIQNKSTLPEVLPDITDTDLEIMRADRITKINFI